MDRDFFGKVYVISGIALFSSIVLLALNVTDWRLAILIVSFLYWLFSVVATLFQKD